MMALPVRKKNRKRGFNYTSAGWYFVTICTNKRIHYLGNIENGIIQYTHAGEIAHRCRLEIPAIYGTAIDIDECIIMPNHMHGIIILHDNAPSLSTIIKSYKQTCSKEIHQTNNIFSRQKSFHDHIIRNEKELVKIQQYIINNPLQREQDSFYTSTA